MYQKEKDKVRKVEILKLPASDWQHYRDLRIRALRNEPGAFLDTLEKGLTTPDEKWQKRLQDVTDGRSRMLFAKLDDSLVGMVGAFRHEDDLPSQRATIFGMYVDPEARGQGVARKLMEEVLRELTETKYIKRVRLWVNKDQIAAINLYQKLGFIATGEEKAVLGDGLEHEEYVMEKEL